MHEIVRLPQNAITTAFSTEFPERLTSDWTPDQPVSTEQASAIPDALDHARAAVEPINPKALAVLLARTAKLWKLPEEWDDIAEFYVEALEDVPLDLVQSALKHVRLTSKWFPKPSEIRASIGLELDRRRHVRRRLEVMEQKVRLGHVERPADWTPPTAEEKARVAEMLANVRKIL